MLRFKELMKENEKEVIANLRFVRNLVFLCFAGRCETSCSPGQAGENFFNITICSKGKLMRRKKNYLISFDITTFLQPRFLEIYRRQDGELIFRNFDNTLQFAWLSLRVFTFSPKINKHRISPYNIFRFSSKGKDKFSLLKKFRFKL